MVETKDKPSIKQVELLNQFKNEGLISKDLDIDNIEKKELGILIGKCFKKQGRRFFLVDRKEYIKYFNGFSYFILGRYYPKYFREFLKKKNKRKLEDLSLIECKELYLTISGNEKDRWEKGIKEITE